MPKSNYREMVYTTPWKERLMSCGIKDQHITTDLISNLLQHRFSPDTLEDESFFGYYQGETEKEAGISIAKEFAVLNALQEFLDNAIDWAKAWDELKKEGWLLIQTEPGTWVLFQQEK